MEKSDLVTHLLVENRKLRQLYLSEQQKALAERRRRIAAEARLAALLGKKIIEMREQNSPVMDDNDLITVDGVAREDLTENGRKNKSSGYEDHIAKMVMNNIKKFQKHIPASGTPTSSTTSSYQSLQDENVAGSSGWTDLTCPAVSNKQHIDPLNDKTNSRQLASAATVIQNNLQKLETPAMSKFWSFIDKNGETTSLMPPPLDSKQQRRKEAFIRRSIDRQIRIQEASARRKELAAQKRKVAKQLLAGHTVNRDAVKVLGVMDREIHAFPPQVMKRETIRRVRKTREYQEKKKRRHDEYDAHINRLLAYCYSQVPYGFRRKY